jgi:hypothetical protein
MDNDSELGNELLVAAKDGDIKQMKMLLADSGTSIRAVDDDGNTVRTVTVFTVPPSNTPSPETTVHNKITLSVPQYHVPTGFATCGETWQITGRHVAA